MVHKIQPQDRIVKNQGWNAVIVFDGMVYSINMLNNEFVEIRYLLNRKQDWEHNKLDPSDYGIVFDDRGYAVVA